MLVVLLLLLLLPILPSPKTHSHTGTVGKDSLNSTSDDEFKRLAPETEASVPEMAPALLEIGTACAPTPAETSMVSHGDRVNPEEEEEFVAVVAEEDTHENRPAVAPPIPPLAPVTPRADTPDSPI